VAREAGVSRGLLHYYFGTKERLLVEVVRRNTEERVLILDAPLLAAQTVDDLIAVMVAGLEDLLDNYPGFFLLLFELFIAGRHNPEIRRELAALYERTRDHVADILREKERQGVISMRFDADATVAYLFGASDGYALQALTDPDRDFGEVMKTGVEIARWLLKKD
jgi:AcrR family transcriptional regulator